MWTRWGRLSVVSQQSIYTVFQKKKLDRWFEGLTDDQRSWDQGEEIPSMMKKEKKETLSPKNLKVERLRSDKKKNFRLIILHIFIFNF